MFSSILISVYVWSDNHVIFCNRRNKGISEISLNEILSNHIINIFFAIFQFMSLTDVSVAQSKIPRVGIITEVKTFLSDQNENNHSIIAYVAVFY